MPQAEAQQKNTAPTKKMKKQVATIGLNIVKSYFEGDCKKDFLPYFHSTLFALDGDGVIEVDDKFKERLCEMHQRAVKDKSRTYADYLINYQIQVLTKPNYEKLMGKIELPYYTPEDNDLLFVGSMASSYKVLPDFIFDDLFYFMFRKIGKKWKIIAVGG
jgi:hypothetical protein